MTVLALQELIEYGGASANGSSVSLAAARNQTTNLQNTDAQTLLMGGA